MNLKKLLVLLLLLFTFLIGCGSKGPAIERSIKPALHFSGNAINSAMDTFESYFSSDEEYSDYTLKAITYLGSNYPDAVKEVMKDHDPNEVLAINATMVSNSDESESVIHIVLTVDKDNSWDVIKIIKE